jgi:glycosyltransferase involved in cell wall biosynthesis
MFSVIIPTYNRLDLLKRAINSVLSQTFQDFEIIVIDDCSSDGTWEWLTNIDNAKILAFRNISNKGLAYNRNYGASESEHTYLAFLDDDDYWLKDHLFELNQLIEKHPNAGLYCNSYTIDYGGEKVSALHDNKDLSESITEFDDFKCFINSNALCAPSTTAVKHTIFNEIGGFNQETTVLEDVEFYVKLGLKYSVVHNRKTTTIYAQNTGDHLSLNHVHLKTLPNLNAFEKHEEEYPYLKKWLDSIRFQIGMKFLEVGDKSYKDFFKKIDTSGIPLLKTIFINSSYLLQKLTLKILKQK